MLFHRGYHLALLVIIIVAVLILIFAGVTLDLSKFRGAVETSIEAVLGREIDIDGPVYLEFSNWPAIDIEDVKLANVEGAAAENFLEADMIRLQIGLFPIIRGEIEIGEITLEDVSLNLETDATGKGNWVFSDKKDSAKEKSAIEETVTTTGEVIGRELRAKGDMLLRNKQAEMNLAFAIKQVDVGAVLSALGLVEGMQASLGDMAYG